MSDAPYTKLTDADLEWMQEWADEWAAAEFEPTLNETQMAELALKALAEIREHRAAQLTAEEREALHAAWYDLTCFQSPKPCGECSMCRAGTSMCDRPRDNCRRCVARKALDKLLRGGA